MRDIVGQGSPILQQRHERVDHVGQRGQQGLFDQCGQGAELIAFLRLIAGASAGGIGDAVTPQAGLDHGQRQFRLPLQAPVLLKGALAAGLLRLAPGNAEQLQAVQQLAALQVIGLAQIQFQPALPGFRRQAQPLLLALQIQLQGQHRRMLRHRAQALADQ